MGENRQPTSVSDAQSAADEDYRRRIRRYTISMIIRVVCLLLAFVVTGPLRWVLLGGAIVFPWVAVVIANSRDERIVQYDVAAVTPRSPNALPPRATADGPRPADTADPDDSAGPADSADPDDDIIPGEELGR